MHIGLNAHLLAGQPGYRAAGIHNYIHQLLAHLPAAAPPDWRWTALVGGAVQAQYPGLTLRRAGLDTSAPLKRILWEQALQPFALPQFDLYHALAFAAPLFLPVPMVVTVYDMTFIRYPQRLSTARRLYLRLFTGLTCRRARRVLCISHSTARDVADLLHIPPQRIDVTPLGYNSDVYRPLPAEQVAAFRRRQGLPERFWLFLGTLEPRKNLVMLLAAYAALPPAERLPLVLAGGKGWDYAPIFAAVEQHGLQQSVTLPGFIPAADLALWYNAAEVFLYPSVFEGFGLPVLEAMACGTPVITSDVSSLPEVAQTCGLCLPPQAAPAWTAALARVRHDAAWRADARAAGLRDARQFQWATTARLTVDSYRQAMAMTVTA
ncbi:MAG: glycosyltransferase family 4 protein [Anaerolineae bacterium]|nr:glycosyltransferase family 4 protein [Anaerolineae bacterium]